MAQPLPHFFRDVRTKRSEHYDQSFQRLSNYKHVRISCRNWIGVEITQLIEELHQRGDARVEMQLIKVTRYLSNRLMRLSSQRSSISAQICDLSLASFIGQ